MAGRPAPLDLIIAIGVLLVGAAGAVSVLVSPAHDLHDPVHGLQQLDLLYLDQPAPVPTALGEPAGRPTLLVLCDGCRAPRLDADLDVHVVVSGDPDLAAAHALRRADGTVGPGYALVDAAGTLRYRTFDPALSDHAREIGILVRGLP